MLQEAKIIFLSDQLFLLYNRTFGETHFWKEPLSQVGSQ